LLTTPLEREQRGQSSSVVASGPKECIPGAACETKRVETHNLLI